MSFTVRHGTATGSVTCSLFAGGQLIGRTESTGAHAGAACAATIDE
ncbi:hypothetical protein ACFOWE_32065 [Planomonospora corallina]|uniref:Uncharacterized protein n=1 Tax=Planomonospora corallina TaxID=1806052 RepID=A0ABV8IHB5_9ACTN